VWRMGEAVTSWVEMGVEGPQVGVGLSLLRRPSTATMLRGKGSRWHRCSVGSQVLLRCC
jgi:hypothetical protein